MRFSVFVLTWFSILLRQSIAQQAKADVSQPTDVGIADFSAMAQVACSQAINGTLPQNPAGLIICYNVANVSSISGTFSADIRMYAAKKSALPDNTSIVLDINFGKAGSFTSFNSTQQTMTRRDFLGLTDAIVQDAFLGLEPVSTSAFDSLIGDQTIEILQTDNGAFAGQVAQASSVLQAPERKSSVPLQQTDLLGQPSDSKPENRQQRAGTFAGVASPSPDLNKIVPSSLKPGAAIVPAVVPGTNPISGPQSMQASEANATSATKSFSSTVTGPQNMSRLTNDSSTKLQASVVTEVDAVDGSLADLANSTSLAPIVLSAQWQIGQEVANAHITVQLDVDQANSNPTNAGVFGSLLPQFTLRIAANASQVAQVVDMQHSTISYLVGVQGSRIPVGAFVFPGRSFLGQDKSVDRVGLFIVSIYIVLFLGTMVTGMGTRLHMRRQYRRKMRYRR